MRPLLHLQCLVVASSTHIALSENFFRNVFSAFCLDWITVFEVSCFPIFSCRAVLIGKLTALSSRNVCEMPRLLFVISFSFFWASFLSDDSGDYCSRNPTYPGSACAFCTEPNTFFHKPTLISLKFVAPQACHNLGFLVFMWRNHIPKLNITFPSEVLVSSDKRPYRNLTFHNVTFVK